MRQDGERRNARDGWVPRGSELTTSAGVEVAVHGEVLTWRAATPVVDVRHPGSGLALPLNFFLIRYDYSHHTTTPPTTTAKPWPPKRRSSSAKPALKRGQPAKSPANPMAQPRQSPSRPHRCWASSTTSSRSTAMPKPPKNSRPAQRR